MQEMFEWQMKCLLSEIVDKDAPPTTTTTTSSSGLSGGASKHHDSPAAATPACPPPRSVLSGRANLIVQAPTGAGKTLVAEALVVQTLLRSQCRDDTRRFRAKAVFMVPLRALVGKTVNHMKRAWQRSTRKLIRVEGFFGTTCTAPEDGRMTIRRAFEGRAIDVLVCTAEIGVGLIEQIAGDPTQASRLGIVVIDEADMLDLGNSRGLGILNALAALQQDCKGADPAPPRPQVVAMSATFNAGQAAHLGEWLGAAVYVHEQRSAELHEHILALPRASKAGEFCCLKRISHCDKHAAQAQESLPFNAAAEAYLTMACRQQQQPVTLRATTVALAMTLVAEGQHVIVFCPTKVNVRSLAKLLLAHLPAQKTKSTFRRRSFEKVVRGARGVLGTQERLSKEDVDDMVRTGVGVHHADLDTDCRGAFENAYKNGLLRVLVATSTLAQGVNMPATVVVICGHTVYSGKTEDIPLHDYLQRIGRAGRIEYLQDASRQYGESYIVVDTESGRAHAERLLKRDLAAVECTPASHSSYMCQENMDRVLLGRLALKEEWTPFADIEAFFRHSFWYHMFCHAMRQEQPPPNARQQQRAYRMRVYVPLAQAIERLCTQNLVTYVCDRSPAARQWQTRLRQHKRHLCDGQLVPVRLNDRGMPQWVNDRNQPRDADCLLRAERMVLLRTPLGAAIALSGLPIDKGLELYAQACTRSNSLFSSMSRYNLIIPAYTGLGLLKDPSKRGTKAVRSTWEMLNDRARRLSQRTDLAGKYDWQAMQSLGYQADHVDAILNSNRTCREAVLRRYSRFRNLLLIYDIVNHNQRKLEAWGISPSGLEDFHREAVKCCLKTRKFFQALNMPHLASLFGKNLQRKLQPSMDRKVAQISKGCNLRYDEATALRNAGLGTPADLAQADLDHVVSVLGGGGGGGGGGPAAEAEAKESEASAVRLRRRAKEIVGKARRHILRMKTSSRNVKAVEEDSESDGED